GQDGRQIFLLPVIVGGGDNVVQQRLSARTTSQLDTGLAITASQLREYRLGNVAMDQQRLHGIAGSVTLCLGVVGNVYRFVRVRLGIDVDMAVAIEMLDDRDLGFVADALDQTL